MAVIGGSTPTINVQVPVPAPVPPSTTTSTPRPRRKAPTARPAPQGEGEEGAEFPQFTPPPRSQPRLRAVIMPWTPTQQRMRRLPRKVVKFSMQDRDLRALFKEVRSNPYEPTLHGALADKIEDLYPHHIMPNIIRKLYNLGADISHNGNLWHDEFFNSYDGTHPYFFPIGGDEVFRYYLGHEGTAPSQGTNQRWIVRAESRIPGSRDSAYNFEVPHEEAHTIPQMLPEASKYISPKEHIFDMRFPHMDTEEHRQSEAERFNDAMDEQERNR